MDRVPASLDYVPPAPSPRHPDRMIACRPRCDRRTPLSLGSATRRAVRTAWQVAVDRQPLPGLRSPHRGRAPTSRGGRVPPAPACGHQQRGPRPAGHEPSCGPHRERPRTRAPSAGPRRHRPAAHRRAIPRHLLERAGPPQPWKQCVGDPVNLCLRRVQLRQPRVDPSRTRHLSDHQCHGPHCSDAEQPSHPGGRVLTLVGAVVGRSIVRSGRG